MADEGTMKYRKFPEINSRFHVLFMFASLQYSIMLSQQRPIGKPSPEGTGLYLHDEILPAHARQVGVLYAEEDPHVRRIFAEILRRGGYAVTAVQDGHEAWEALQAKPFDLLITDNDMPRLTGVQVVTQARHHGLGLPVIVISGNVGKITIDGIENLQFAALLQKPVLLHNLFETMAQALSQPANIVRGSRAFLDPLN